MRLTSDSALVLALGAGCERLQETLAQAKLLPSVTEAKWFAWAVAKARGVSFAERLPPSSIPTGTVTFMFSDIEGSTIRWERDRAAMTQAVRLHDAIMREAISAHDGYVFKTIGDAFCAAFHRPEDAANAAVAAQRALLSADFAAVDGLRVRMAVHTGTADERDGDYFGPTVNRVARLLTIGYGGQVLTSGATADLVRGSLASQSTLADLGEHRLKDLALPEHVFALLAADLPSEFAPLRSLDVLANNLPLQLTSFVGREREVNEITELLAQNRLVTLVGSGGIGKTRTSLQVAANVLDGSGDGVWFIELAPLASAAYIPATIALALGLTLPSDGDPIENLVRLLSAKKKTLLVFDNCEHLVEGTARIVSALVRGCPRLAILASSRQGLGVAGEVLFRMPTLPLPAHADAGVLGAAEAARYASIMLFVDRARAADQRFALTDENAPIVADICRRLDGIALAIELAAPRVKILNPRQLRDRLDERFRVLTGGSRDVLPRQQTLRALIDWSHDLLDDRERALFRRLSIFVDGFTIEGATAVGSGEDLDEFDVFDLLASLVDKSLVLAEPGADAVRYRLLESTRAYGLEKLAAVGERERTAQLHLQYLHDMFLELAQRFETTAQSAEIEAALTAEREDVRAALDFGLRGPVSLGAALLVSITESWARLNRLGNEFLQRAEAYLAGLGDAEVGLRAGLWYAIGKSATGNGRTIIAMDAMSQALTYARAANDPQLLGQVLGEYAWSAMRSRRLDEADRALVEAEALPNMSKRIRISGFEVRARWFGLNGDHEAALRVHEMHLVELQRLGDERGVRHCKLLHAECHHALGNTQRAIALVQDVLPRIRADNNRVMLTTVLPNFTGYLAAAGELLLATATARELINLVAPVDPASFLIAITLEHLALVLALQGDPQRAAVLEGYADSALRQGGFEREYTETTSFQRLRAKLVESLAPDDLERLLAEGAGLAPDVAIHLAQGEPIT